MANNSLDKARKEINKIDREMAELFVKRMRAVEVVAEYKKERGLAILDSSREEEVIRQNSALIEDEKIREYYLDFLRATMTASKNYQSHLIAEQSSCEKLHINLGDGEYNIYIGRGLIAQANQLFDLDRRVLILTDSGVPKEYAIQVKNLCRDAVIFTMPQGEDHKTIETISKILSKMLEIGMTRTDCVVAVGGGIVGDVAGFAASTYMRGIDFYNIPTTLLSQVDSSIGGKTAVNLCGVKNIVGAFYQPKAVIIDPDLLKTLPERHIKNGLAEVIKMAICCDGELFNIMKNYHPGDAISEEIILGSLQIKKQVVEADEKEGGIRRVLNFGHTFGHAIESKESEKLYHGECVAIGMTAVCSKEVKEELVPLLRQIGLPTEYSGNLDDVLSNIKHDKKCAGDSISWVYVDEIGKFRIEKTSVEAFCAHIREELGK